MAKRSSEETKGVKRALIRVLVFAIWILATLAITKGYYDLQILGLILFIATGLIAPLLLSKVLKTKFSLKRYAIDEITLLPAFTLLFIGVFIISEVGLPPVVYEFLLFALFLFATRFVIIGHKRLRTKLTILFIVLLIVLVYLGYLYGIYTYLGELYYLKAHQAEFHSTGTCSSTYESSNITVLRCLAGQSSGRNSSGFKLLQVNLNSTQILIYNTCEACLQSADTVYRNIKIMNLSLGQVFGGPCESIQTSKLLSTNITDMLAVYEVNASVRGICI